MLPGDTRNTAFAINDNNVVLGASGPNGVAISHYFLWENGVLTPLTPPAGEAWNVADLNNSNDVVGQQTPSGGQNFPMRVRNGVGTRLPGLPGSSQGGGAAAINNQGQIAGYSVSADGYHAVLWQADNTVVNIPKPAAFAHCFGLDIDDLGQVVVVCMTAGSGGTQNLFVWDAGTLIDLGPVHFTGQTLGVVPFAINNRNQVVGQTSFGEVGLWTFTGNLPPIAQPGGPYAGTAGIAVNVNGAASSDPNGDAITYAWDFGDGTTGTGPVPSHVYTNAGTFTVQLTVTDARGASNSASTTATIVGFTRGTSTALTSSIPLSSAFTYSALPLNRANDINDHEVVVGDVGANNIASYWTQAGGLRCARAGANRQSGVLQLIPGPERVRCCSGQQLAERNHSAHEVDVRAACTSICLRESAATSRPPSTISVKFPEGMTPRVDDRISVPPSARLRG